MQRFHRLYVVSALKTDPEALSKGGHKFPRPDKLPPLWHRLLKAVLKAATPPEWGPVRSCACLRLLKQNAAVARKPLENVLELNVSGQILWFEPPAAPF